MKKADILFSLLVRSRGKCQAKGLDRVDCKGRLECAHIISRSHKLTRFDEMNALCLCAKHHFYYTNRPHKWFWDFIPKKFPKNYKYLLPLKNKLVHSTDFEAISIDLQDRLDKIE